MYSKKIKFQRLYSSGHIENNSTAHINTYTKYI